MRKKKLLLLLPLLFLYVGCDKDSDSTPPPPAYVGEYDLTQVIFACGDNQSLSVTDETNIINGELVCTSDNFLFSMSMYDYQGTLTDCFVGTNNEGIFAAYDATTLSLTMNGPIEQIGSDSLKITNSESGDVTNLYWSKISSNLIIRELDGWQYFFEEK
tara:strand:+ start:85 stop:561 length:477 start_codon:yes stop_codon:yes gene_type:complete